MDPVSSRARFGSHLGLERITPVNIWVTPQGFALACGWHKRKGLSVPFGQGPGYKVGRFTSPIWCPTTNGYYQHVPIGDGGPQLWETVDRACQTVEGHPTRESQNLSTAQPCFLLFQGDGRGCGSSRNGACGEGWMPQM